MSVAVFDVDGTLVRGLSTERGYFRWLLARGHLGPRQLGAFLWFNVRWFAVYGWHTFKKNKAYLSGLDENFVAGTARAFVRHDVQRRYDAHCVHRLRSHLTAGDQVLLLTGTLMPIASAIAESLGVHGVVATACATRDGCYTAAPPLSHPFGDEKRALLETERRRLAVDGPLFAYCDSGYDIALLESVDSPVCVRPDRRLRAHALARGWEILEESRNPSPVATAAETGGGKK
jgi:phosphoserine phosphatase